MFSQSKELIDEFERCMSKIFGDRGANASDVAAFNGDQNATVMLESCNLTMLERMEAYVTPLWESHFLMALVYCSVLGVALLVGTFGNLIILVISATTRTMNRIGRDFVINLALADLCVAAVADPMCILGVVKGERWFQGRLILCEVVASMCLTACFCAFLNLFLLTFNRYVFVCMNAWYEKIFRRPMCLVLCVSTWLAAFLFEFPNFIGWGDHYFDQKSHQCIWDRTASFSYTLTVSAGLIGTPLVLMGLCFVFIFHKIYISKRDVFALNMDDPLRMTRVWKESWRSSRTLVVIFLAFLVCWTPYAVITAIDVNDTFSMETHLWVTFLAHLHSSLNFTIYMIFNENFRRSVFSLLSCNLSAWRYRSSVETAKTRSKVDSEKFTSTSSDYTGRAYLPKFFTGEIGKEMGFKTKPSSCERDADDNSCASADEKGPPKF